MRFKAILENKEKLDLVELPYGKSDLEPEMSKKTIELHYDVLSKGYVDRFNNGEGDPDFNRAGAMLHNLFWVQLQKPRVNNKPTGPALSLIEKVHGGFEDFRDSLAEEAAKFQGSGWVYMARDGAIKTLKNQSWKNDVIMPMDIWEHSYIMDYGADRRKYMRGLLRCINWTVINDRLNLSS
jgi:Fe-Mn family superoxide dismutase